jgi:hypothetical protein
MAALMARTLLLTDPRQPESAILHPPLSPFGPALVIAPLRRQYWRSPHLFAMTSDDHSRRLLLLVAEKCR